MKFGFDHTYVRTDSESVFRSYGREGFQLLPEATEHPGSVNCRFIMIPITDDFSTKRRAHYLEFCEIMDREVHLASLDHPSQFHRPGFCLRIDQGLEPFYEDRKHEFSDFQIEFSHKNYDWKCDSAIRLPGWNFVKFKQELIPGIHTWLTEYERPPSAEKLPSLMTDHTNGTLSFTGFVWDVTPAQMEPICRLTQRKLSDRNTALKLDDQTTIWLQPDLRKLQSSASKKQNPFLAVVLKTSSLEAVQNNSPSARKIQWQGRPAMLLEQASTSWDVVFVE